MSGRIRQSFKFEPKARDCMSDTTQPRMLYFTCGFQQLCFKKSGLPRGGGGYNRAI